MATFIRFSLFFGTKCVFFVYFLRSCTGNSLMSSGKSKFKKLKGFLIKIQKFPSTFFLFLLKNHLNIILIYNFFCLSFMTLYIMLNVKGYIISQKYMRVCVYVWTILIISSKNVSLNMTLNFKLRNWYIFSHS